MRRKSLLLSIVMLVAIAVLLTGSDDVRSQDADEVAPQVIDVWPLPGVELSPDESLTVTFNQAMDQETVETAFNVQPALTGSFAWSDARTVDFLPDGGWQRATEYAVMINQTARAVNGLMLEDTVLFEVKTVGPLEVAAIVPDAGAEGVAADAWIVVTFNRPVVPLVSTEQLDDLPTPIEIDPPVEGAGEWLNTSIYVFNPAEALRGGTNYTVRVPAGLIAVDGAELGEDFSWSFRTLPPQILSVSPGSGSDDVLLERNIQVRFSQPMEKASTETAFALIYNGQPVAGTIDWQSNDTTLIFTPVENLVIDSLYLITVADTARSAGGEANLTDGYSGSFRTVPYPGVRNTSPNNGQREVYPGSGATIYFRSLMNTDTLEGKVVISPETEWLPETWGNDALHLRFVSMPNTIYTITLLAGAEDIYGNAIETDYTFSYTTGDIATWAYPIFSWGEAILQTGAHRQDTRMSLMVSGQPEVEFWLYTIDEDEIPAVIRRTVEHGGYYYYYDEDEDFFWVKDSNLLRRWTQTFDSGGIEGVPKEVLLASMMGGALPNGTYWLVIEMPERYGDDREIYQFPLSVVTANLTVKRAPDETMVWVTDMPTSNPVQETTVSIYHRGEMVARGQTDSEGIFRFPVDLGEYAGFDYIEAEGAGAYGVWYSYNADRLPTEQQYLYTDRPIYRPGETVYFRGVLRDRVDMTYSVPNRSLANVVIMAPDGQQLFSEQVPMTEFGTFSGELVLPEDVAIGDAIINVEGIWLYFQIAEFRVPEFEVGVTAQQDPIFQGETLNAIAEASYYFGGGVSNAEVYWSAYAFPTFFNYTGPGRYSFYNEEAEYFYSTYIGDGSGTTDSSGRFVISTDNTRIATPRPMTITVEASVTDESYQSISGRTSITAHPANVYVGLRSDRYFGREGQPMNIELVAVDIDSVPLADKQVELTVVEVRWSRTPIEGQFGRYSWTQEIIEVETTSIRTDEDGKASYEFTPPNAGIFRVRATAHDEYERTNSSTLRFWVMGQRPVWWGEPSQTIDLVADKDTYQPGDVAQILIPIPFQGRSTVLVSAERAGIMSHEVIQVEGSTLLYELPITEDFVPMVHFSVTLVKGIDEESLNPDFRIGTIALEVEPVQQRLTVTVTPSSTRIQPGETLTFDVEVTDVEGNPVQAEIGLVLTDKAILSLAPANSGTLEDTYYSWQPNHVYTSISITALLDRVTDDTIGVEREERDGDFDDGVVMESAADEAYAPAAPEAVGEAQGMGGGGDAAPEVTVREDFQQTPLWEAHVVTDETGHATVSVDMPDNLTTWTLDARALTVQTEVGQATTDVVTTLPLLVRPVTPRFLVVGDRVHLASVINNNTDEEQTVEATLLVEGVDLESQATQSVTIPAGSRARVEWMAVAQDVPYVDLTFIAIGADGYQDATKPTLATGPDGTIPVYRYTAPDHVGTGGVLREGGARTEGISLPTRLLDTSQGELVIHVDPSLAVTTIDSMDYLWNYPHQCIEQTVSRFLPNVMTYRALKDLNISDPELEADLYIALEFALERLTREQNPDGGWGWFSGMDSNPLVTAYAVLGLIEARDAGFEVDQAMIDRALNFVQHDYIRPNVETSRWRLNRQAFYFYVLARDGKGSLDDFNALLEWRLNMSYMSRAYLLMAYHELFPNDPAVNDLISDLNTAAIISSTGAHWEEEWLDWWNWTSNTRTTAVILNALVRTDPDSELLPNAVRWLMVARRGDHWETTQETAWAVMALTDWMVLTGELEGNYTYDVALNREGLAEGTVTPDTVRDGQVLRVAVSDLLLDEVNRLVFVRDEGPGVLYYTAHMNLRLYASEVDALNRGVMVNREYFIDGDRDNPVTSAVVGDVVTVRLTITLTQDVYYFVLEDPIPAGTEPVDTSLLTTSQFADGPSLRPVGDEWFWYWGWWLFDRTEMRDEQVNLYADFLPRGTYVYTYQIRASVPGEFQTMPAEGYAFYFPEVFGRTKGMLFTVSSPEASVE